MIIAAVIATIGFLATAVGSRRYGYRLGGTIVIGVLAVYTLKNFSALPLFLGSTAIAYAALWLAKRRTLIYGRDEFVVALLAGSVLPATVFLYASYLPDSIQVEILQSVFIGSLLSGIAAFNLHRIRPGHRYQDVIGSIGLYIGLIALGALLISPSTRFLADYTPLVLFSETSDIAVWRNAVVPGPADPALVGRPLMIAVFALTLGFAEYIQKVYGVYIGTVAMGLLAIYTVSTWRLLALFLLTVVVVFVLVTAIYRSAVLYGRALLSIGAALGMMTAVPISVALGITSGISAVFTAIIAGIFAYYLHRVTGRDRYIQLTLAGGVFTGLLLAVRAIIGPTPEGLPQNFGIPEIVGGLAVVVGAFVVARHLSIREPSDDAVRAASVFTRGGD